MAKDLEADAAERETHTGGTQEANAAPEAAAQGMAPTRRRLPRPVLVTSVATLTVIALAAAQIFMLRMQFLPDLAPVLSVFMGSVAMTYILQFPDAHLLERVFWTVVILVCIVLVVVVMTVSVGVTDARDPITYTEVLGNAAVQANLLALGLGVVWPLVDAALARYST